ncbi:hypothetical protein GCM10018785_09500 [Streptomyces longispororuber]|uniref:Uncharacterized protein n=1 Tax=Streptomyces longispororuber TaxID=68230 RepID=A0A919DF04_9ACTN|nr:hypothetical protein GCM10018785_09500 [Streptomyces longispororuber]
MGQVSKRSQLTCTGDARHGVSHRRVVLAGAPLRGVRGGGEPEWVQGVRSGSTAGAVVGGVVGVAAGAVVGAGGCWWRGAQALEPEVGSLHGSSASEGRASR